MIYQELFCFITLVLDIFTSVRVAPTEKDLQIALLRQQLRMLERNSKTKPRLSRPEKLMLVTLVTRLKAQTRRFHEALDEALLLVQPDTVLKWHRHLVHRKWTFPHPHLGGRPRLERDLEARIVRIARENSRMGYDKIQGELLKLGFNVHPSTVKNVLRRHGLPSAPQRGRSSWSTFLKHYQQQMPACDFSPPKLFAWKRSTCSSSSNSALVVSTWRAARLILIVPGSPNKLTIHCRDVLGGILHDDYHDALEASLR